MPENKKLGMLLKAEVTSKNLFGMFLNTFSSFLFLNLKTIAITYLLVQDYNVAYQNAAKIAGRLGLVSSFFLLPSEFLTGTLTDIVGRRKLISIGYIALGGVMFAMTRFKSVFPSLYICSILYSLLGLPAYTAPLNNDYLLKQSQGVYGSFISLINFISGLMSISGTIYLQQVTSINTVFDFYGVLMVLTGLTLMYTL